MDREARVVYGIFIQSYRNFKKENTTDSNFFRELRSKCLRENLHYWIYWKLLRVYLDLHITCTFFHSLCNKDRQVEYSAQSAEHILGCLPSFLYEQRHEVWKNKKIFVCLINQRGRNLKEIVWGKKLTVGYKKNGKVCSKFQLIVYNIYCINKPNLYTTKKNTPLTNQT